MAQRRMFDKEQILSDQFTSMNLRSQLAYMKLCMNADDDGFISNTKNAGASPGVLKELQECGYIFRFSSKILLIRNWLLNNQLRKDTYKPTNHLLEKSLVVKGNDKIYYLETVTQQDQNGIVLVPQIRKDKISKEKIRTYNPHNASVTADACGAVCENNFDKFWNSYPNKVGKREARKAFKKVDVPIETLLNAIQEQKKSHRWQSDGGKYIPDPANWLNKRHWEDQLVPEKQTACGATGSLGPAELAAIRQALTEASDIGNSE